MENLVRCFFGNSVKVSDLPEMDETFLQFVQEAVQSDCTSSEDELVDLVTSLFPDVPIERSGLSERIEHYRLELKGDSALEENAKFVALQALDDSLAGGGGSSVSTDFLLDDDFSSMMTLSTKQREEEQEEDQNQQQVIDEESLSLLRGVCGLENDSEDEVLVFIMTRVVLSDVDDTARWLVDNGFAKAKELYNLDAKKRRQLARTEAEAERAARERIVRRFDERPEPILGAPEKIRTKTGNKPHQEPESKVRYLDGKIVATNGAKYIEVGGKEQWDGGSKGRIKTKGKRGPGWVAA